MMTPIERLFAVLEHKPVDRLPVVPFIGNWSAKLAGYNLGEYHTDGKKMADAHLKAHALHGLDEVNPQSDNYYIAEGMGVKVKIMEDDTPVVLERPLKSLDDVGKLRAPDPSQGRMPVYLEAISILKREVGGEVIVRAPGTGSFSLAGHLLGTENLVVEAAMAESDDDDDARAKIHALMEVCTQALIAFSTEAVKCGATILQNGDSLASINMISPAIYREYCFPYEKKYFAAMDKLKPDYKFATLLHICGANTPVVEDLMKTGCDIIEIDHAVDLVKYKECSTRNNVLMLGNLNPAGSLLFGTPEDVVSDSLKVLNIAAQDGFFMLGSGCEVPIKASLQNVRALLTASEAFTPKRFGIQ